MINKKPRSMTLEQRKIRIWNYKNNRRNRKAWIAWSTNQIYKYKVEKQQEVTNATN